MMLNNPRWANLHIAISKCGCRTCHNIRMDAIKAHLFERHRRMIVCKTCGNKRCPHANNHIHPCSGSNKPGQKGSAYE